MTAHNLQMLLSCFAGYKVVLVSSGAVGVGCCKMGLKERPVKLAQKQAVSAVGQIHLMRYYQDFFAALGLVSYDRALIPPRRMHASCVLHA